MTLLAPELRFLLEHSDWLCLALFFRGHRGMKFFIIFFHIRFYADLPHRQIGFVFSSNDELKPLISLIYPVRQHF